MRLNIQYVQTLQNFSRVLEFVCKYSTYQKPKVQVSRFKNSQFDLTVSFFMLNTIFSFFYRNFWHFLILSGYGWTILLFTAVIKILLQAKDATVKK